MVSRHLVLCFLIGHSLSLRLVMGALTSIPQATSSWVRARVGMAVPLESTRARLLSHRVKADTETWQGQALRF